MSVHEVDGPSAIPDGFMTIKEFEQVYKAGRSTIYNLAREGKLRIVKVGRVSRISIADARAWAASLPSLHEAA